MCGNHTTCERRDRRTAVYHNILYVRMDKGKLVCPLTYCCWGIKITMLWPRKSLPKVDNNCILSLLLVETAVSSTVNISSSGDPCLSKAFLKLSTRKKKKNTCNFSVKCAISIQGNSKNVIALHVT